MIKKFNSNSFIVPLDQMALAKYVMDLEMKISELIDYINNKESSSIKISALKLELGKVYENEKKECYLIIESFGGYCTGISLSDKYSMWCYTEDGKIDNVSGVLPLIKLSSDQRPYRV